VDEIYPLVTISIRVWMRSSQVWMRSRPSVDEIFSRVDEI
jgi:hypothetical protein